MTSDRAKLLPNCELSPDWLSYIDGRAKADATDDSIPPLIDTLAKMLDEVKLSIDRNHSHCVEGQIVCALHLAKAMALARAANENAKTREAEAKVAKAAKAFETKTRKALEKGKVNAWKFRVTGSFLCAILGLGFAWFVPKYLKS
jgi:hypothetical protein